MKWKVSKKITALFITLCMLLALVPAVMADGYAVTIDSVVKDESEAVTGAIVTVTDEDSYTLYAATYTGGALSGVVSKNFTASGTVTFDESLAYNSKSQTLRLFAWSDMEPVSAVKESEATGFTATFETDSHVSITVSDTQSFDGEVTEDAETAIARDSSTGKIAADGSGQVNFKVVLDEGYEISGITVTNGTYKNLKKVDTDIYRVTKITADTTIKITTALSSELEANAYTATFDTDAGVESITVSETDSYDYESILATNAASAVARDGDGGYILSDGNGQVNFVVNLVEGYQVASVTVIAGTYKAVKTPTDTKVTNGYRVTKLTGDTTITITTEEIPEETGDGIIHLKGTSIDAAGVENVTVDGSIVTITAAGEYEIEGTLTDGQIAVASTVGKKDEVNITLENVSVTNSTGSAFDAENGKITLITETANTFETTAADAAAVYSKKDLTIQGGGSITANSDSGNGIHCKKDLTIKDVNVSVEAGNNGIKGNQSVKITKGADGKTIHVEAVKDGICSDQAPELDTAGTAIDTSFFDDGDTCGTVTINGGTIDITTTGTTKTGDGIQADQTVTIANNPDITITATGEAIKANFSQLDLADASNYSTYADTMASYNGCIVISGGTINATAGEDGIKAVKDVTVSGGSVTVTEAGDDGIQAGDVVINTATPSNSSRIDGTVTISGGTVDIKKAAGDGIVTTQTYAQSDGTVTIVSAKDGVQAGKAYTQYDISGSGNDETVLYETNGVVNITGGSLTITAAGGATRTIKDNDGNTTLTDIDYSCKGIKARKLIDISGGTLNINALDDAIHSNHTANISGGTITVQSCDDGVHGEYFLNISGTAYIDVQKSYEGIEGSKIYISGGETYVAATDDGANAAGDEPTDSAYTLSTVYGSNVTQASVTLMAGGFNGGSSGGGGWGGGPGMNDNSASYGYIEVSGGLLYIEAEGDGFDSNGSGLISGGTVLVNGPTSGGNGVFDIGDSSSDTLVITGGTVIGAGTKDMAVTPNSASNSQAYVVTTLSSAQSAGKAIQVLNGNNEITTYIPSKSYQWIFVSTPSISSGTSYTVKYGGSVSGGTWAENYKETYGIKTGTTFTGGSSSSVTAVTGGSSSGSSGGPGQGGPGGGGR